MKSVFFGTPEFSVNALETLSKHTDVLLVVTQEDKIRGRGKKVSPSPVKEKAIELGIEVFQPQNINSEDSLKKLKDLDADLFVVVAYGQILKKDLIEIPKMDIVNIHASLLPKLRGAAPIQFSIFQGHEKTGVCIMRIEEGLDSGPVAIRKEIEIANMDYGQLSEKLSILGAEALKEYLVQLEDNKVVFIEQDHKESTYAHKINNNSTWLDFYNENASTLEKRIRALSPSPTAKFKIGNEIFKIYEALVDFNKKVEPGHYVIYNKMFLIGCKEGTLSIQSIQRSGKKRMEISAFLAGFNLPNSGKVQAIERG